MSLQWRVSCVTKKEIEKSMRNNDNCFKEKLHHGSFITIIDKLSMVLICELHANRHFTLREIYVPPPHRLLAKHHVCREWFTPNGSKAFLNSLTEYFVPRSTKQTADEIMIIILLYNSGWWVKGRWGWNNEFQFYWQLIKFSTFCLWKCQS